MLIDQRVDLEELPNFAYLHIEEAEIEGKSLKTIAEFIALTELRLFDAAITDAGLKHLSKMMNLPSLVLFDTNVTAAALSRLGRNLGCHVRSDCLTYPVPGRFSIRQDSSYRSQPR